jgi:hypothetical protein
MIAIVTVARALQALNEIHQYVDSKTYKQLFQEVVGDFNGSSIIPLVTSLDAAAAKTRSTDIELEHVDMFCLARDFQYGQRSRRYIYQQAQQEKLRYAYELFALFARENGIYDLVGIAAQGSSNPAALTKLPLSDFQVEKFDIDLR